MSIKKCLKLKELYFRNKVESEVLSLIGRYCHYIKSLMLTVIKIDDKILDFFGIYGHKLEEFELYNNWTEDYEEFKQILKFCSNLYRIYFQKLKY